MFGHFLFAFHAAAGDNPGTAVDAHTSAADGTGRGILHEWTPVQRRSPWPAQPLPPPLQPHRRRRGDSSLCGLKVSGELLSFP